MMNVKYILISLLTLFCGITNLHPQEIVKGIFHTLNDKPIEYILVTFYKNDSTAVKQCLTDNDGRFEVDIAKGEYLVQAKTFGTKINEFKLNVLSSIDLGIINVNPVLELEGIEVVYKKKILERKVDRVVFNVENSILALSGDAYDVLKTTPNVKVENNTISIIGKSSLRVMINGNLINYNGDDLVGYLKTISSDRIKNIEIITNPPSQYEAEGNSGLINIILKSNIKNSWNGSTRAVYTQTSHSSGNIFENINFSTDKFSMSSNISYGLGNTGSTENMNTYNNKQIWSQNSLIKNKLNNLSINLTTEYEISSRFLIGGSYTFIKNKPKNTNSNTYNFVNNITLLSDSSVYSRSYQNNEIKNHAYNIYGKIKLDSLGKNITININHYNYFNNNNRYLKTKHEEILEDDMFNSNMQKVNNISSKIDVSLPFMWGKISFGSKYSLFNAKNFSNEYKYKDKNNIKDQFNYIERNQAIYTTFEKSFWNKKLNLQIGVRAEFTQTIGESKSNKSKKENKYWEIFPTAYILYTLNDHSNIALSYGRRINRPNFSYLNPFKWVNNPYYYSEGNPFLKPSFTNNIELNYIYKNLYSSIYYYDINDGFGQITTVIDKNSQKTIFENYYKLHEIGILETYNFNYFKWLSSYNSINISYINSHSISNITDYKLSGFNFNFSTSNDFYLNKDRTFIININYWQYFKGITDLKEYSPFSQLDMSVKILLAKKRLQVSLACNDILKTNYPTYTRYTNQTKVTYRNYYDLRCFIFSLTYKFGGQIKKKSNSTKFGDNDDEQRISL